jgi:hypothetical protein
LIVLVSTIIFGLLFIPALGLCALAPMLADAPGSEKVPGVLLMIYSLFAFPVVIVVSLVAAWILFALGMEPVAGWVSLVPVLNVAMIIVAGYRLWGRRSSLGGG